MAAGTGFLGYGSVLKKGAAGAGTTVGEILSIPGPDSATDDVEITHSESPDAHKEYIPGLVDGGEVSVELQMEAAGTALGTLYTDHQARTTSTYHILWSNSAASTLQFSGYIKGLGPQTEVQDKVTVTATFKITGKPVFAA